MDDWKLKVRTQTGGKTKRVRISFAVTWISKRTVLYTRPAVSIAPLIASCQLAIAIHTADSVRPCATP